MNKLNKSYNMPHSEIKIKAIHKRPPIRIKRKNTSSGSLHRVLLYLFKSLGLYRRAH